MANKEDEDVYMFVLTTDELQDLWSKNSSTKVSAKSRTLPKAFTEKGSYGTESTLERKFFIGRIMHTVKRVKKTKINYAYTKLDRKRRNA